MNSKLRRRLIVVTGVIIIVIIVVLAIVQGATGARTVSVAEAASGDFAGRRIQVSGKVVDNSYEITDNILTFAIYDEAAPLTQLWVRYDGALSATFGNQVTAICTGTMSGDGILDCYTLVTQCPSKYESATDALSVSRLLAYGPEAVDVTVKVSGSVKDKSLQPAGSTTRLVLVDLKTGEELPIHFNGGLASEIKDGSTLVITGSLDRQGLFLATDVSLEE